jgi:hypothetical protein
MDHQKEAGVFVTVSELVEQLSDNPAVKVTVQEIAERVRPANSGLPDRARRLGVDPFKPGAVGSSSSGNRVRKKRAF